MKYYAGIGSRRTPQTILNLMTEIAVKLSEKKYILRSGHAIGADIAFENGITNNNLKEIFVANDATNEAIEMASKYHPFWDQCQPYARKLHGRNSMIILGKKLDIPVKFVICYTPDGGSSGGTGLGMNIAESYKIPIFNLYYVDVCKRMMKFVGIE